MKLYNSLSHEKEDFKSIVPGKVSMYTCGPTVYHYAHIGNLRSYIMEDVLEKYLRFSGYDVKRVMNITDVGHLTSDGDTGDDKMLKGAKREHKTVMEIADFYTKAFFADCAELNIKTPDVVEPATHCIDDFIKVISSLIEKGYAYEAGGNIYFDTSKLKEYYVFGDFSEDDLAVAVREGVDEDGNKRNKADFVLWFTKSKFDDQELKWDSPWGVGYPGWHIECSGISMKYNGEYLDLHCGGIDNAFPHHTNEIAQSESYLGHPWCPQWFHVAHLNTSTGKMSKSKGEFLTVSLLEEKGYDPLAYRFFCLQSHYRKALVFSWENLDNAAAAYSKLIAKIAVVLHGNAGALNVPAGIAHAPRGVPFQSLILKFGFCEPEDEIVLVALVGVLFYALPDAHGQIFLVVVVEYIVARQLGRVKIHVAAGKIGIAGVQQPGDDLDIVVNEAGGGLDYIRALDIQLAAVGKEGIGVELGNLHDGLMLTLGALEHLVLALVGVGGQVAHIGDVHDAVHIVSGVAKVLLQHILHDIAAEVADVGKVVDGGAAGVHLHMAGGVGLELLFLVGGGIIQIHGQVSFMVAVLLYRRFCGGCGLPQPVTSVTGSQ